MNTTDTNDPVANTLAAAHEYVRLGLAVVPIPSGQKSPVLRGWPNLRIPDSELATYFSNVSNIGVILGAASGGLVDIDCDVPEAAIAARILLPPTGALHGRLGNPGSHYYYFVDPVPSPRKFVTPDGTTLLEIRGDGQQTLAPPSVHPSGEVIRWERTSGPSRVDGRMLVTRVEHIAAAALLARTWPAQGRRNDASNALAGTLLGAGWSEKETEDFMEAVATAAKDEESRQRIRNVVSTEGRLMAGKAVTGRPTLSQIVGVVVVNRVGEWLNLAHRVAAEQVQTALPVQQWPEPLADEAFYGVAGDIVRAIEPHTESDVAALLVQFLAAFGNVIGRSAHFKVEGDKHFGNLYALIVGATAKGRKGTSWSRIREVCDAVDPSWADGRIQVGLSSGEGLIWAVRDPVLARNKKGEEELIDEGVSDKRLLVFEGEFASVLHILERDGNTLSPIVREAWDRDHLQFLTKHAPAKAHGAHITIIAHITREELLRNLNVTERANGFANRFMFICARRSKLLPDGGSFQLDSIEAHLARLRQAVEFSKFAGRLKRDDEASELWTRIYSDLSEEKLGLLGAVTSRSEAQVLRLSILYALLDSSAVIRKPHLSAALAVWRYSQASAEHIFGTMLGDPIADEIHRALKANPGGLTRSEISGLFARHKAEHQIERALQVLAEQGWAVGRSELTGGRPAVRWNYLGPAKNAK